jgi:hypothetical protein
MLTPDQVTKIIEIGRSSPVLKTEFGNQGRPPIGFVIGSGLAYGDAWSSLKNDDEYCRTMSIATRDTSNDVLDFYRPEFTALGMDNNVAGEKPFRHAWMMMFCTAMPESGGKFCCGWDREENRDQLTSETAETGLFQVSHNSAMATPLLPKLMATWQRRDYVTYFHEGISCNAEDLECFGGGLGLEFQKLCKDDPVFAYWWAVLLSRFLRPHWGTINRRIVYLRPAVNDYFMKVQGLIDAVA